MLNRLKNLWAWSSIDPYVLGAETGKALAEALRPEPGQIIFPNLTQEEFQATPSEAQDPEEIINNLTQ